MACLGNRCLVDMKTCQASCQDIFDDDETTD